MDREKILGFKPVSLAETKELLDKIKKDGNELSYEQDLALKYAKKFAKLKKDKADKLIEELRKIEGMDEEFAVKLVDILPENKEMFELMLSKNSALDEEAQKQALETVKKFAPKSK